MNEWIDVKNEMPKDADEQYICNCTHGNNGELVIALIWDGEYWSEFDGDAVNWVEHVTHWMHMPKPFVKN